MGRKGKDSKRRTGRKPGTRANNAFGLDPSEAASASSARPIASRGYVRAWAWIIGAVSFLSPFALLGLSPRPAGAETASSTAKPLAVAAVKPKRPVIIIVTRKIIETQAAAPSVSTSGGGVPSYSYTAAPVAAPVAVSCGTHPC